MLSSRGWARHEWTQWLQWSETENGGTVLFLSLRNPWDTGPVVSIGPDLPAVPYCLQVCCFFSLVVFYVMSICVWPCWCKRQVTFTYRGYSIIVITWLALLCIARGPLIVFSLFPCLWIGHQWPHQAVPALSPLLRAWQVGLFVWIVVLCVSSFVPTAAFWLPCWLWLASTLPTPPP